MRRLAPWLLVAVLILGSGALAESAWRRIRPSIPEIGRKELEPTLGQGVLLGVLGGLRTVVADIAWIRSYVFWERRDRPGCEALMRTACALDPHARYFWENAGLRIGLDMAHWEIRRRGGYAKVPAETQERLFRQYARRGLDVLEEGLGHARNRTALLLAAGFLAEGKLKDLRLAADYYRQAAEAPDARARALVQARDRAYFRNLADITNQLRGIAPGGHRAIEGAELDTFFKSLGF